MDPLSDVLGLLKPRSYMAGGLDLGGDWCLRFPPKDSLKCYVIVSGQCWLAVDGVPGPAHLTAGDCFLLPDGRAFTLASDLSLPPTDAMTLFAKPLQGTTLTVNGGGNALGFGGVFELTGSRADILLNVLPPVVHLRGDAERSAMRWSMDRIRDELRHPQPGSALVSQQLVTLMLVQALRLHLSQGAEGATGWLFALADRQMAAALTAIHEAPSQRWSVETLAARAGMSRSVFAERFKATVGETPMGYLTRWRMLLAADRLATSKAAVSTIALSLGYESESAFSTAFKRTMGCSPRQYNRTE